MTDRQKKVLTLSLIAYALAGIFYSFGLSLQTTISTITFYVIGSALLIAGILSLYNNYKLDRDTRLYIFLAIIGCFLEIFFTIVLMIQILSI